MIAKYYGVSHSQDHIANVMGCGWNSGCSISQQLKYYKSDKPNGLGKKGSCADASRTWEEAKNEVNKNRPLASGVLVNGFTGHMRCCRGWKECSSWWGGTEHYLYINDPWPVNEGRTYWENWDDVKHISYIYVKD